MKHIVITLAASVALFAQSNVKVMRISEPEKALKMEVIVPAPLEKVWEAFTTSEGAQTWLWSSVTIELRTGGPWIVNYPGGQTGGGTIVSFIPNRQVVIRAMAPEKFPTVRRERTQAVFDFEPARSDTKVTLTQTGWKSGAEWDEAYEYLSKGNAQLLEQLRMRFVKGPIDWTPRK